MFWTITVLGFILLAGEWGAFVHYRKDNTMHGGGASALLEALGSLPFSFEAASVTVGINIAIGKLLYTLANARSSVGAC